MFYFFMSQYLFCEKSNRRLWFNDTVFFFHLSVKRMWGYRGGWGHVFFAKLYLEFILYFHKKNPIFLYNFCQKWLIAPCSFFYFVCFIYVFSFKQSSYQKWRVGIPLTGLSQPHCCTCPKSGPGLPISWYLLCSVSSVKMRSDTVIVRFVDVSWNTELMTITA
jgi:hypothetical protein